MFGSAALDIAIGLIFVFLLYSLLASIVQEIISVWIGLRARILKKAIVRMLNDGQAKEIPKTFWEHVQWFFKTFVGQRFMSFYRILVKRDLPKGTFAESFYEHPLIKYLGENTYSSKPAYLSSKNFSKVMIDRLTGMQNKAGSNYAEIIRDFFDRELSNGATRLPDENNAEVQEDTFRFLNSLWADAQGDVDRFKTLLENWYNDTMERATGWYKQYTQLFLFFIGLGLAIAFNVNTVRIAGKLATDPALREQLVQQADAFIQTHPNLATELAQAKNAAGADTATAKDYIVANSSDIPDAAQDSIKAGLSASAGETDSLQILWNQQDSLLTQAREMVQGDVANLNQALGLGYDPIEGRLLSCHNLHRFCKGFFSKEGFVRTIGWILTALAISLGAPFWFDLLNKLMQLRGAVKGNSADPKNDQNSPQNPVNRKG